MTAWFLHRNVDDGVRWTNPSKKYIEKMKRDKKEFYSVLASFYSNGNGKPEPVPAIEDVVYLYDGGKTRGKNHSRGIYVKGTVSQAIKLEEQVACIIKLPMNQSPLLINYDEKKLSDQKSISTNLQDAEDASFLRYLAGNKANMSMGWIKIDSKETIEKLEKIIKPTNCE